LVVRSIDKAGRVSANVSYETFMPNALPTVQLVSGTPVWGRQVTLKLTPAAGLTGVTGFNVTVSGDDPVDVQADQYQFDSDNGDVRTVSADADGTAHITWTPTTAGFTILTVSAVEADGSVNPESNDYFFEVPGDS
jgi:hypothetical protein